MKSKIEALQLKGWEPLEDVAVIQAENGALICQVMAKQPSKD